MPPRASKLAAFTLPLLFVTFAFAVPGSASGPPAPPDLPSSTSSAPPSTLLAPRSGPRGPTLFATLPPAQTGVTAPNLYDDPAMWDALYHPFNSGAIGTGIAIGDYDGDGRPDLYVVCKTAPNHLFRNLGNFRFEDVTARTGVAGPAGPWKQGAAFVDVNNDGRLDLYICRFGAPNLLFINQGDGTFREEAAARGLAVVDACGMAAFCDYDRDGWLDVYVQTNLLDPAAHPRGQRDHLFHNNRDGTFAEVTAGAGIAGETQGHSATWWDFDEDGWPDLYVANDFAQPDQLYHNNHNGTFTDVLSAVVPHTPHFAMGADLADLNNDGHIDLLVADMAATTRYKDHRGMARLRAALPDDQLYPHAAPQLMQSALYLGTGTSRVLEAARLAGLAATDWTFGPRLEDLDLDGRVDAYFTNGMAREFHNADLVARSLAAPNPAARARVMKASPPLAERHLAFRNLGDLQFENVSAAWGLDHLGISFGAAFGDLDGDGDLDLVFASYDGDVTVCRNDADTGHAVILDLRGTASNRFGVGATVRLETDAGPQVRTLTLARGYLSTSEPIVHFGLGAATTIRRLTIDWPSGAQQTFTDLPADRRYTISEMWPGSPTPVATPPPRPLLVESAGPRQLALYSREQPLDERAPQPLLPFRLNRPGPALACADLDGDGVDDLALGGVSGNPGRLLTNFGDGNFLPYGSSLFSADAALADGPLLAFDADADGDLDLLVTKGGVAAPADSPAYATRLLLNDGHGRFSPAPAGLIPDLPLSVGAVAAADFEHHGRLAVFLGARCVPGHYPDPPRSALLVWRDGRYVDVIGDVAPSLAARGMVTAALWSDVDGDSWPDLLVAFDWGPVACYRNLRGTRLEDISASAGFAAAGTGWWRSLASADFNGDGRPDFAVGNTGLNTRYRASPAEPATLYAGVSLDGSAPQLVETTFDSGREYPLRPRDLLVRAFPSLARRFPTAESYARASLADVFPAPALAAVRKLTVTELRSGVFLSQPDGTWRFTPLPRLAQIAPIHGLVAVDIDGDGHTDLLAVGNDFSPVPETGRFDGGLGWLLRGDGHGGFTAEPPDRSGFVVPGDARALVVTDLDQTGAPAAIVTRSDDTMLAFSNPYPGSSHRLAVTLRGPPGNPAAIGARLTLTLGDGSTQTTELSAGSGCLSQSTATAFFSFPDGPPPPRLTIRWPDGHETTRHFSAPPPVRLLLSP